MKTMHVYAWRVFRLLFFAVLAYDEFAKAVAPIAPSTLNMSKAPWLYEFCLAWVPTAEQLARIHAGAALAATVASLGPERFYQKAAAIAGAHYALAYFGDASDRYQHHYLLCLLLCFLPWARDRAWVRSAISIQLGLVYMWTAVAKLVDGGLFLEGHFVRTAAMRPQVFESVHLIAGAVGIDDVTVWSLLALGVVATEVVLAVLLGTESAPLFSAFLGLAMHLGFEVVGKLSIGLFSWYMIILFVFFVAPGHANTK